MKQTLFSFILLSLLALPTLALAEVDLTVKTTAGNNFLLRDVQATLSYQGESYVSHSGDDGVIIFHNLQPGHNYTVHFSHPNYTFAQETGVLDTAKSITAEGTGNLIKLRGTVFEDSLTPISGSKLFLNGTKEIVIDPATGTFEIDLPYGSPYQLSITNENYVFFHSEIKGVLYGDTERLFIAYNN